MISPRLPRATPLVINHCGCPHRRRVKLAAYVALYERFGGDLDRIFDELQVRPHNHSTAQHMASSPNGKTSQQAQPAESLSLSRMNSGAPFLPSGVPK